jgi:hypothetical protein
VFLANVVEKIKINVLSSKSFFFLEILAVFELTWKNIVSWAGYRLQHGI